MRRPQVRRSAYGLMGCGRGSPRWARISLVGVTARVSTGCRTLSACGSSRVLDDSRRNRPLDEAEGEPRRGELLRCALHPRVGHTHALLVLAQTRIKRSRLARAANDVERARRALWEFPIPAGCRRYSSRRAAARRPPPGGRMVDRQGGCSRHGVSVARARLPAHEPFAFQQVVLSSGPVDQLVEID